MFNVYLAGGLRNNWQEKVVDFMVGENAYFFNPQNIQLGKDAGSLKLVANKELDWLDETSIVFAYLEADNPSGIGLAAEIGYATAKNLYIIFVDEKQDSRTAWLTHLCDYTTPSFEDGLNYLRNYVRLNSKYV